MDKEGALQRLNAALNDLLAQSRAETEDHRITEPPTAEPVVIDFSNGPRISGESSEELAAPISELSAETGEIRIARSHDLPPEAGGQKGIYRIADLSALAPLIQADQFHLPGYTPVLRQLIEEVLRQEAPILDAVLVQRIARAHGFQRSGRLIRDRVLELAEQHHYVQQAGFEEVFVWHSEGDVAGWTTYRIPASSEDTRAIEEVAAEELSIAAANVDAEDKALEVARLFGIKRLTGPARERMERIFSA